VSDQGARDWYDDGVASHYATHGASYRNPHEPIVNEIVALALARWTIDTYSVLDLCAGSGELTRAIRASHKQATVVGCDPFTFAAYERETGRPCERFDFAAIAGGAFRGRTYTLVGCSFAMHLCAPSLLPQLALELAQIAAHLLILTPHKRPVIHHEWGWQHVGEFVHRRVRSRLYASTMFGPPVTLRDNP
jgi:SAM-dependent methyltransferase